MIKTVMFDLDDTLFDHKYSRLCALEAMRRENKVISKASLKELEREHEILLSGNYLKVLDRTLTIKDSMVERTYQLFAKYGVVLTEAEAENYTIIYKKEYESNRKAIPGVIDLIRKLKDSVKIGIVTNGMYDIQMEKVRICQLEDMLDFLILSDEIGARKPEKAIFEAALLKSESNPEEVVFIGDSWSSDVIGATNCGIKSIWLNRYNQVCPDAHLAYEINSFYDIDSILNYIIGFNHKNGD